MSEENNGKGPSFNKLMSCPFCDTNNLRMYPDGDMEGHSVMGSHAANCPLGTFGYETEEEAIKAWNTRVDFDAGVRAEKIIEMHGENYACRLIRELELLL